MFSSLKLLYIADDIISPDECHRTLTTDQEVSNKSNYELIKNTLLDKHGIDQTIKLIEYQKDEDVATIRERI